MTNAELIARVRHLFETEYSEGGPTRTEMESFLVELAKLSLQIADALEASDRMARR